jgi:SAM-dependent methyltransferase
VDDPVTDYTHEYIRRALTVEAKRLLEVGCGDGALAARLQSEGFEVVAVDADAESADAARARGVDARAATWPTSVDGRFDALLFTRSLHHIDDLEAGIGAAFACLNPGGNIIIEDFDFGFADEETMAWFATLVRRLRSDGMEIGDSGLLAGLAAGESPPIEVWNDQHHHDLHPAARIEAALRKAASRVEAEPAAYFFRYIAAAAPERRELIEAVRTHELDLIGLGKIAPLGRRYVACA